MLSCAQALRLPLGPRTVTSLAAAWPQLTSRSLSVMQAPELVPEALELLDLFQGLRK